MVTARRRMLLAGSALMAAPAVALAQAVCRATPPDDLGPFYKPGMPAGGDLCRGAGSARRLLLTGRVLGAGDCRPLAGATVDVWQADANGEYTLVERGRLPPPDCLLRGVVRTGADGAYRIDTIVPGRYVPRPRHVHFRVEAPGHRDLVTQVYFDRRGAPDAALVIALAPAADGAAAVFDITLAPR